jgi:hypothetical protein
MASLADAHRYGQQGTRSEFTGTVDSQMGGKRWREGIKRSVYGGGLMGGLRSPVGRW